MNKIYSFQTLSIAILLSCVVPIAAMAQSDKEFYGKPEQTSRLSYMITEEKVIAFLNKSVKVKEVDAKDLAEESN